MSKKSWDWSHWDKYSHNNPNLRSFWYPSSMRNHAVDRLQNEKRKDKRRIIDRSDLRGKNEENTKVHSDGSRNMKSSSRGARMGCVFRTRNSARWVGSWIQVARDERDGTLWRNQRNQMIHPYHRSATTRATTPRPDLRYRLPWRRGPIVFHLAPPICSPIGQR